MAAPASVPELLDRLRRSGLVPVDRLDGFLAGLATSGPGDHLTTIPAMLDRLVSAGLITRFHADKLAAGKYKGFQLGSYLILDQLGAGGMGQVYLAEHTHMRRLVALKVLNPQALETDTVARERFFREARAAGTLDHPNIVRVFDLSQEGKVLYFAMEYVDGLSLHALVAQRGPLEVGTACHYARQVAFGLRHAHDLGFVHRDIKPANLLLDRSGLVKILDLGLVRSEADAGAMLTRQFDKKNVLGTADYVAPEQAVDSSTVDARADVYSLGATLYFLLAGRPLFPEGRTAQKLVWQQIKEPPPLARLRPGVPPELAAMVHRMLKKRPADRFPTVGEVFDALAPFDPGDVPPPDLRWLPEPPARVALARPAPAPARPPGGSQSHIVIAAMRSGTGGSSAPLETGRPDSARLSAPPPGARPAPPRYDEPPAPAHDDTPAPSRRPSPALSRRPIALLVTLSVSLVLALAGIVVLLLRQ